MGRQSEAIINHFSHPHPLHLTNPQPYQTCLACNQTLGTEPFYSCKAPSCTTFTLHVKCTQLPHRITHPCHNHHHTEPLSLAKPNKPNGVFTCHACEKQGAGFAYSCKDCDINIHVACATLPLYQSHGSHAHQLNLVFSPPYGSNAFSCDICGVIGGSKCWLYRCVSCGFDAHLSCATSKPQVVTQNARSVSVPPDNLFLNQFNNAKDQYEQAIMGGVGASTNRNNQILQAMVNGGGGGGGNPFFQGIMGRGGGGGNPLLQEIMGGGGGNPLLQRMMGGGGGNPLLQRMMGGGGGDLMQGLLGGSNGGLGGMDLSSLLGGGDTGSLLGGGGGMDLSSLLGGGDTGSLLGGGDIGGLMGAGLGGFGF